MPESAGHCECLTVTWRWLEFEADLCGGRLPGEVVSVEGHDEIKCFTIYKMRYFLNDSRTAYHVDGVRILGESEKSTLWPECHL